MNKSTEIRNQFIEYFKEHGHTVVPSVPVVPTDDPTLLFINAGMNQFKDVFLEQGNRSYTRAVNSQKCIRVSGKHNDLEEVGQSPNHHTFFEMLGNWSFGDYYKREAIEWAWDLVVNVYKIDPKRLYATVYEGDDQVPPDEEARQAWLELTDIQPKRVSYHGLKDNFWEMGEVGPCGPCSELHYDLGAETCTRKSEKDHVCRVNVECGRFVELWNLVFIQYRRDDKGELHDLPRKHVDTGAGLERFLRVIEGVNSTYETSLFTPIISELTNLSGVKYSNDKRGIPHRVAVDHIRMLAFALADGALPSNEGRGYVLRRILRRAARYGREIGLETPFLYRLVDPLVGVMGEAYPQLKERYDHIVGVIRAEEENFARTLGRGLELFGGIIEKARKESRTVISGDDAFKLYDTYGFPIDLTQLMAQERNLKVDDERFDELMNEQRVRARGEGKFDVISGDFTAGLKCEFVGYENSQVEAEVLAVKEHNESVEIVLNRTPFYAEAGGQVTDRGTINWGGKEFEVQGVSHVGDVIAHNIVLKGAEPPQLGDTVVASLDREHRLQVQYNHTATHLLHTALRKHLSQNTSQMGSLVAPDRFRFDFNHFEKLSPDLLEIIEYTVNKAIRNDYPVKWYVKPYKEAIDSGIIALFGERYGEEVRVVQIGSDEKPYSQELCGGTHVERTGQIGLFRIVSESAVSAGVRRIEAVTGKVALDMTLDERRKLDEMADLLSSHGSDPVEKLAKTLEEKRALEKEFERLLEDWAKGVAVELLNDAIHLIPSHLQDVAIDAPPLIPPRGAGGGDSTEPPPRSAGEFPSQSPPRFPGGNKRGGMAVISRLFDGLEIDRMKLIGDQIRAMDPNAVALLASPVASGAGQLCCVVGDALIDGTALKAGDLVGKAARLAGGGGGGKHHMATAGAKHPQNLTKAVKGFLSIIKNTLEQE